jgi:hypothetical protein
MQNKIFKVIFFFSIVSMVFVGGNVLAAATCGTATECFWADNTHILDRGINHGLNTATATICVGGVNSSPTVIYGYSEGGYVIPVGYRWYCGQTVNGGDVIPHEAECFSPQATPSGPSQPSTCYIAPLNGQCGTANNVDTVSAPTSNFCTQGYASSVKDNGTSWGWTCGGFAGGTTATCSANKIVVNGACGTANGKGFFQVSDIDTAQERCAAGTFTSISVNSSTYTWGCNGINNGTNASCTANKVACGTANAQARTTQPSGSAACDYSGTSIFMSDNGTNWTWLCQRSPGTYAGCYTNKTACGNANRIFSSGDTGWGSYNTFCTYGTSAPVTPTFPVTPGGTVNWTCTGNDSVAVNCSATRSQLTTTATCGSSSGQTFSTPPATGLCTADGGHATNVLTNPTTYTWKCSDWWMRRYNTGEEWNSIKVSSTGQYQIACRTDGEMFSSSDYGVTFANVSNANCNYATISSTGQYQTTIKAGEQIYVSSNYGATWTAKASGLAWTNITMSSTGQYQTAISWSQLTGTSIYVSSNYGATWTNNTIDVGNGLYYIAMSSTGQYQTINGAPAKVEGMIPSKILTSSNYGVTWTERIESLNWRSIAMSSTGQYQTAIGRKFLGSYGNETDEWIQVSSDYGVTWTAKGPANLGPIEVAVSSTGQYQTVVGGSGGGYISSDYGVTWTAKGISGDSIAMSSTGQYQTINGISVSSDYGATWSSVPVISPNDNYNVDDWNDVDISSTGQYQVAVTLYSGVGNYNDAIYGSNNYGGTSADCSATRLVNGTCGTANNHGYIATSQIDTSAERCATGAFGLVFVDKGSTWEWNCNGAGGGTNATCSARKVACGTSNGQVRTTAPSTNLCTYGSASGISGSGDWTWTCTDAPGVINCITRKTLCGTANKTFGDGENSWGSYTFCTYGTASPASPTFPLAGQTTPWTCTGNDSVAVNCSATKTSSLVNGICGTDNTKILTSTPTNLCATGTATSVSGSGPWTWTCNGSGGGTNQNCSTDKIIFNNPLDLDGDDSCWYCEHYYDSYGTLTNGHLINGRAVLDLSFTLTALGYDTYKIGIGTSSSPSSIIMETTDWLSFNGSNATFNGISVVKSGTDQKDGNNAFFITYGNGTSVKPYYWFVKLTGESDWRFAKSFNTPKKPFPVVKVISNKMPTLGASVQYCTTLPSYTATTDPCYSLCWKGTEALSQSGLSDSSKWKCSICYDSAGLPTLCTTGNVNAFSWTMPTNKGVYVGSAYDSPNPVFKFNSMVTNFKPGIAIQGSECAGEGDTGIKYPLPRWREIN